MHLLFLTPQLPYPPRQGTTIRNFGLIRHLAARHTIDLCTFLAPGESLTPDSPLHQLCRTVVAVPQPLRTLGARARSTLLSPLPDMALRLEDRAMHAAVGELLASHAYDIIQVEGIELAQYARQVLGSPSASRPKVVFDNHNCEYLLQQRNALTDLRNPRRWHAGLYSLIQWAKLRAYEAHACTSADAVIAVSDPDRVALNKIAPSATIKVIPNGLSLDEHAPTAAPSSGPPVLLFTGKMDYRPNVDAVLWFAQTVLPRIVAKRPDVCFQVVGMNPHPRLDTLRTNPNVHIVGAVPIITPYLEQAAVYVMPLRVGGGTRFKALEAMAASKPLVSSSLGVEGIPVTNGTELLIADPPEEFADAVLELLADREAGGDLGRTLGAAARLFVTDRYTWDGILPELESLYAILHSRPDRGMPATTR
jgi:polysaccharide biosynthesis protein PslH